MYDIKILNARIPDYTDHSLKTTDICISKGRISFLGITGTGGKTEIDAAGKIAAPGFIDIHMHEEELYQYKELPVFYVAERMLRMGVTTCVGGNCGVNAQAPEIFCNEIEKQGAPTNYMTFLGHNYLRRQVGIESPYQKASRSEMDKMKEILHANLHLELPGLSFGIEYDPGMDLEEMAEICASLDHDRYLVSVHARYDGDQCIDSLGEVIALQRITGLPMQISHIGSMCAYGHMDVSIQIIENAIHKGQDLTADCYPYSAFCTDIGSTVFEEGCFERWKKPADSVMLLSEPYKNIRCTEEILKDAREKYPRMPAVAFVMNEEEVVRALKAPFVFVGSDSGYEGLAGHPRGAGTFPRVLGKYVREEGALDLIDMLKKMTLLPAGKLELKTKGDIREGCDADIVIFDPDTIRDKADYVNDPSAPPEGIEYVILGGQIALEKNQIRNGTLGRYIRKDQILFPE